jgi:hypothetical protein
VDEFLNKLVGAWNLRGMMGDTKLFQEAVGRWVLKGLFIELRFHAVRIGESGNPPYEAIYLIGYDSKLDNYVLHLFDTFGVTSNPVAGIGKRNGNTIRFEFAYNSGPFTNVFTWHPKKLMWTMKLTSAAEGKTQAFAQKEMTRKGRVSHVSHP